MTLTLDLIFLTGVGLLLAGLAQWSTAAAMVVGGLILLIVSIAVRINQTKAEAKRDNRRDSESISTPSGD